jgi:hypothetical protein
VYVPEAKPDIEELVALTVSVNPFDQVNVNGSLPPNADTVTAPSEPPGQDVLVGVIVNALAGEPAVCVISKV